MAKNDLNDDKQRMLDLIRNIETRAVEIGSKWPVLEHEIFNELPNGIDKVRAQAALESLAEDGEIHTSNGSYSTIGPITGWVRAGKRLDR